MTKLAERESLPAAPLTAAPALAVQFFLIPLAVVAVLVSIYAGFRMLVDEKRTAQDYLNDIRFGGRERRWPAAYELSKVMGDPKIQARDPSLGPALLRAFQESKGDDPRVRRYLALAVGRLTSPLPGATAALLEAAEDPDTETAISAIWALGSLRDAAAVRRLQELYGSPVPEIRKVTVYVLGALPGDMQRRTLQTALEDPAPDVQWNAAIALARHGDRSGIPVLRRMLDREYLERTVQNKARTDPNADPIGDIMISSLKAVAALKEPTLREPVGELSRGDRSLRVRQAARDALKQL